MQKRHHPVEELNLIATYKEDLSVYSQQESLVPQAWGTIIIVAVDLSIRRKRV
jgi:hypothetical protein